MSKEVIMKFFKNTFFALSTLLLLTATSQSYADDFGCKAVLCFAGGKGLSECASTITEVKKRLAKGKGFPHCSFVSDSGQKTDLVHQTGAFTRRIGKTNICPDGTKTSWYKDGGYRCAAIIVTFKGINEDGSDRVQEINW